jgi:hypothetical protein
MIQRSEKLCRALVGILALITFLGCSQPSKTSSLTQTWFAHKSSVGFMNLERMALDLRPDSTYRYYTRLAPIPPAETGKEIEETGRFNVRGDTLFFTVEHASNRDTTYYYSRQFRVLPDTSEWPFRIKMKRGTTEFEIHFQAQ